MGDCVTTAGCWPQAVGFVVCSVSVYIARNLGVGPTPVSQVKEHQLQLVQGSEELCH